MQLQIFTVDAFSEAPFGGNPAAVVPLVETLPEGTLQDVAKEMNLSETAYVSPVAGIEKGDCNPWTTNKRFTLRWFTPTNEVALCGHATLATAHVLFTHLKNKNEMLEFETKSGVLVARRIGVKIVLDFPSNSPQDLSKNLEENMNSLARVVVGENAPVKEIKISHEAKKLVVRMEDSWTRKDLESLRPDTQSLLRLHDGSVVKGVIVTLRGQLSLVEKEEEEDCKGRKVHEYHVLSRYFAPWNGIPEDPVTGSAHTVLGPYWSEQLGRKTIRCRQCSPRGGDLEVTVRNDGRVDLTGIATTVIQGHITI